MGGLYPIHLNVAGRLCVVVGGGPVAERKVSGLLEAGARVRVISIEAASGLLQLAENGEIELILAAYEESHLADAYLIFAATDRRDVNAQIAADAGRMRRWANIADAPEESDFFVPAVVRRGDLCLSVSTGGNQPLLAARIAEELEARFGAEYGAYVSLLGRMRAEIKVGTNDTGARRKAMEALLNKGPELRSLLAAGEEAAAYAAARDIVTQVLEHHK